MSNARAVQSQITFLYYNDLEPAVEFFQQVMGFELVEDQGFAKIFRTVGNAFVGLVDGERGFRKPLANSAVLLTLAVNDVDAWHEYLAGYGVKILKELKTHDEIQVRCFFFEGPGGYAIEVQQFLKPELQPIFHGEEDG